MAYTVTKLLDGGHFFEGPRWRDGYWWVSDFYAHQVLRISPDGTSEVVLEVPGQPSGLGWMPDGSLLVVSMKDAKVLRRSSDGTVTEHADISSYCGGHANDMAVDAHGRAFVGNFGFDLMGGGEPTVTNLVRVDPDGTTTVAATDMYFPNGAVIEGNTLIVGETMGCRYTAFDIDDAGNLENRRVWAELGPLPTLGSFDETLPQITYAPDGCAMDQQGRIWFADALGGRAARVAAGGTPDQEIPGPDGLGIFACAIGGPSSDTMLLCCAPDFFEHERAARREAALYTVDLSAAP